MPSTATAFASSAFRFRKPTTDFTFTYPAADSDTEVLADARPSDTKLDAVIGPIMIAAHWLPTIERRIVSSIAPLDEAAPNDGRWVDVDVAAQAIRFFQANSDVLPASEPYIYTSMQGDLVAEFTAPNGKMTNIVGKSSVVSFAAINGTVLTATLEPTLNNVFTIRHELHHQTDQLSGKHGIVEP
jgi:hypothetical protein